MKKIILVFSIAILSLVILSCKKKYKQPYIPNGWYVGEFIYDSMPEKNFTDSFFCNRDFSNKQYEFITLNILDSVQKNVRFYENNDLTHIYIYINKVKKNGLGLDNFTFKSNGIFGNFYDDSLTGKFSLIYMP